MAATALITGGTSGIGRAVAGKLAELGVHVVVVGRNVKRGEKTIADIRAAGGLADFIASIFRMRRVPTKLRERPSNLETARSIS